VIREKKAVKTHCLFTIFLSPLATFRNPVLELHVGNARKGIREGEEDRLVAVVAVDDVVLTRTATSTRKNEKWLQAEEGCKTNPPPARGIENDSSLRSWKRRVMAASCRRQCGSFPPGFAEVGQATDAADKADAISCLSLFPATNTRRIRILQRSKEEKKTFESLDIGAGRAHLSSGERERGGPPCKELRKMEARFRRSV